MPKNTPCPRVSMPPRPQASPMPTATIAKHRYLPSRSSRKGDSTAGATTNSSTAAIAKPPTTAHLLFNRVLTRGSSS